MEGKLTNDQLLQIDSARQFIDLHGRQYLLEKNILGIGIGLKKVNGNESDEIAVKFFVEKKIPEQQLPAAKLLPKVIIMDQREILFDVDEMDMPVVAHLETGIFKDSRGFGFTGFKKEMRDTNVLKPGDSSSNIYTSIGTVCLCLNREGEINRDFKYFLSCNHVFANFNSSLIGTPVVRPSVKDGGYFPNNYCGYLVNYIPIKFGPAHENFADVGIAYATLAVKGKNEINGIGPVSTLGDVNSLLGSPAVKKIGRTSGITSGCVQGIYCTIKVNYWGVGPVGQNTIFKNQVITSLMGAFGDSGSLLLNEENAAIGMLFAGSATHTFFNPLEYIFEYFSLEL